MEENKELTVYVVMGSEFEDVYGLGCYLYSVHKSYDKAYDAFLEEVKQRQEQYGVEGIMSHNLWEVNLDDPLSERIEIQKVTVEE